MEILLLCYEYPPLGGGGGVGAQQYAEAWAAKGHRVTVLTSGVSGLAARPRSLAADLVIRIETGMSGIAGSQWRRLEGGAGASGRSAACDGT